MPDRSMNRAEWRGYFAEYRSAARDGKPEPPGYPPAAWHGIDRDEAAFWLNRAGHWRRRGVVGEARERLAWAAEARCPMGV